MVIFIIPIVLILISFAVKHYRNKALSLPGEQFKKVERKPIIYKAYYLLFSALVIIGLLFFFYDEIYVSALFVCLSALIALLSIAFRGCYVIYDKKVIRSYFLWKSKTVKLRDIMELEVTDSVIIRTKDDLIVLRKAYHRLEGCEEFVKMLQSYLSGRKMKGDKLPPRVRKFKDAVFRSRDFIVCLFLYAVVTAAIIAVCLWYYFRDASLTELERGLIIGTTICFFVMYIAAASLTLISAKRAHSSKMWKKISRLCIKDFRFKD